MFEIYGYARANDRLYLSFSPVVPVRMPDDGAGCEIR